MMVRVVLARRPMRIVLLALALLTTSAQLESQRGFRTGIELVEVDVRVTDTNGRFLSALGIDDFEVFDEDERQQITGLRLVGGDTSQRGRRTDVFLQTAPLQPWIVVFDDQHLEPSGIRRARLAVEQFVRARREPLLMGIVYRGRLLNNRVFGDRLEILRALSSVRLPGDRPGGADQPFTADLLKERGAVTSLATITDIGHQLTRLAGAKTVVLFSDGFQVAAMESAIWRAVTQLRRAQVRVYAVDTRGIDGGPPDVLNTLAFDTGGMMLFNRNDLNTALADIDADSRTFYLLTYSPTNKNMDGRFRRITVKSRIDGASVRARFGYFAADRSR